MHNLHKQSVPPGRFWSQISLFLHFQLQLQAYLLDTLDSMVSKGRL